mgnify:CR=1 FL=1|jgi:hypothetical protein
MSFFLHEQIYRDLSSVVDQRISICGVGALGANLAETLARMGFAKLHLIDRDRVEAHNLSTQPWMQQDIGAPKARTLAAALYRAIGARVEAQHVELGDANAVEVLRGSALVVDAFDNLAGRRAVAQACQQLGVACLHVAIAPSGDYGGGFWNESYVELQAGDVAPAPRANDCNYPLSRPLALLVANAAAESLIGWLRTGEPRNFEVTLRDLQMR